MLKGVTFCILINFRMKSLNSCMSLKTDQFALTFGLWFNSELMFKMVSTRLYSLTANDFFFRFIENVPSSQIQKFFFS